jgi:hypothetical protein
MEDPFPGNALLSNSAECSDRTSKINNPLLPHELSINIKDFVMQSKTWV